MSASGDLRPLYDFAVEGPVQAEVFVLWLDGSQIMLTGPCGPEAWYVELGEDGDPVDTVTRMAIDNIGAPLVVHSTSWRRTRGAVVLSFVAVIAPGTAAGLESIPVRRAELARSGATTAPTAIVTAQVLEHGLRHLAWLVADDDVVRNELAGEWASVLAGYVPEPFRHVRLKE